MPPDLADAVADYHRSPSRLGLHDLLRPFAVACHEVARAHGRGSVHLGLTPRLILLGDFGETAVGGWDRAPAERDAYAAAFLAPEQAADDGRPVGPAADVYALGAVLYSMLTAQPPYTGATTDEVLTRVREGLPWQPRMVAPRVPAALEGVCLTAMEREAGHRYASAADLAREVERWMAGERVRTNYVEPKGVRVLRWARSNYGLLTLTILLLAALFSLAVAINVIRTERRYYEDQTGAAKQMIEQRAEELRSQRALSSEELATTTRTLAELAAQAQRRRTDEQTLDGFKQDVLRRSHGAAQRLASLADQGGRTDLAAANDRLSLGELFLAMGQPAEARRHIERAAVIAQASAQPQGLASKNSLFRSALRLGQVDLLLGQPAAARRDAGLALAAAEECVVADPGSAALRRDVASCQELLGDASLALHDLPAARAAFGGLVAAVETYARPDSPNVQDRLDLANCFALRGKVEWLDHRYDEAASWFGRALAILRPLKAEGKLQPHARAVALLGELEARAEECRAVLKAVDDLDGALREPEETALRLLTGRAAALARRGRPTDAAATAEKLRELKPDSGANLYNVACCYALCVPALAPEQKAERADYTRRALEALRAAAAHGFRNVAHIEADFDLDALHGEPGYRALVAELKGVPFWLTFPAPP